MKLKTIPSLDGIRAVAVFIVVLSHCGMGHIIPGGFGVTTFFFLSGFLITCLLLDEYKQNNFISLKCFYLRRVYRLAPPLIVALTIGYFLCYIKVLEGNITAIGISSQIFYLANYYQIFDWGPKTPEGMGILWSLAVEEHFYIFYPLVLVLLIKIKDKFYMVAAFATICLCILVWRIILIYYLNANPIRTYYSSDTRIDSILFGCILAVFYNPFNDCLDSNKKLTLKNYFYITFAITTLLFTFIFQDTKFKETFRYTIQGAALTFLFYYSIKYSKSVLFRWLNRKVVKTIGIYSYSIYLIHTIIIHALKNSEPSISNTNLFIATITISIGFAYIIDRHIDYHFRKLRKMLH